MNFGYFAEFAHFDGDEIGVVCLLASSIVNRIFQKYMTKILFTAQTTTVWVHGTTVRVIPPLKTTEKQL